MNILIVGNKEKINNWNELNNKNDVGRIYSPNRFYSLINEFIDINLKKYGKIILFFINYLLRSNNFKHETSITSKKSIFIWLLDIFCWICCAGFFVCLLTGIATPIINSIKKANFKEVFSNKSIAVWLIVVSVLTFSVALSYIYLMTKIVSKNKKLNLKEFVCKKIDYLNSISFLIDFSRRFSKNTDSEELIVLTMNDEINNDEKWLSLQVNNKMLHLFSNFNISLKIENISETEFNNLKKIINFDFQNLDIVLL